MAIVSDVESFGIKTPYFLCNAVSCIGGREENQDSATIIETRRGVLVVVCDGMGGMAGGATASSTAVNVISEYVSRPEREDDIDDDNRITLIKAISEANSKLYEMSENTPGLHGMGTTVTALLINEDKASVAFVGDSRIYQIRDGRKVFRTFDHSMVFEMVRKKIITEEQARLSAQSNVILRALGLKEEVEIESYDLPYDKGDLFLLCTDGIWGTMPERELLKRVSVRKHPQVVTETLARNIHNDAIRAGGGHDNLTAAIVKTTSDSNLRSKMEKKITIALEVCAALLLLSLAVNAVLSGRSSRVEKKYQAEITAICDSVQAEKQALRDSLQAHPGDMAFVNKYLGIPDNK